MGSNPIGDAIFCARTLHFSFFLAASAGLISLISSIPEPNRDRFSHFSLLRSVEVFFARHGTAGTEAKIFYLLKYSLKTLPECGILRINVFELKPQMKFSAELQS